jgi:hypothetical protein
MLIYHQGADGRADYNNSPMAQRLVGLMFEATRHGGIVL